MTRFLSVRFIQALLGMALTVGTVPGWAQPVPSISPSTLTFGSVTVNTSQSDSVFMANTGDAQLNASGVSIVGTDADQFSVSPVSLIVGVGGRAQLTVTFSPTTAGAKTANLQIVHNAEGSPATVTLNGTGAGAEISVSSPALSFGSVIVGQTVTQTVTISNPGITTLTVSNMTIIGTDAGHFRVSAPSFNVAPGDSHQVLVTFAPASAGSKTASLSLQHNAPGSPLSVSLAGIGIQSRLRFADTFAKPGSQALVVVSLDVSLAIAGVQFTIAPHHAGNSSARFSGLINELQDDGFTATSATDVNGITTVLVFSTSGILVPPGNHLILQLVYNIDPVAPPGDIIDLVVSETILSDANAQPLPSQLDVGKIYLGQPGDVAGGLLGGGDGHIDIVDIIKEIKMILGILLMPQPFTFEHFTADLNADGRIDILDIVAMINVVLSHNGQPKGVPDGPTSPATVSLGELQTVETDHMAVSLAMSADGLIAGIQARLTFDPAQFRIGTPYVVGRAASLTLHHATTGDTLTVVIYSITGQGIAAGSGTIVLLPVTVQGGSNATPTVTLSQIVLADQQARAIPVTVGVNTVTVSTLPSAYALRANSPNPFNPGTRIAYDLPQPARVRLSVYNLLGQEVVRLVDEIKAPGRYVVTWDGRNEHGIDVASGVYLYRMTTSTGFSQSRRMTLVR